MSKKEIADCLNEVRFLASIRQKNIVGFLEAFTENNEQDLCIVMEYCGCGDLAQKVERYKRRKTYIDEDVIWRYLIQSLKALSYLHERGICHRDIKTANSFLAEDGSIKMGDMNVSKKLKQGQLKTQIGTPYYMSPEIWNNRPYDFSSDLWSLGCMVYELCALKPPFTGTDFPSLKRAVTAGRYSHIPKKYTESLSRVVSMMLKLNPRERPSAEQLLRHHEMASKLQLDEGKIAGVSFCDAEAQRKQLLQTIMVPQNLRQLNKALPKPAYPDRAEAVRKSEGGAQAPAPAEAAPAPPVPPMPQQSNNSRAPLAPLPENLKEARAEQKQKDKAGRHKEKVTAAVLYCIAYVCDLLLIINCILCCFNDFIVGTGGCIQGLPASSPRGQRSGRSPCTWSFFCS